MTSVGVVLGISNLFCAAVAIGLAIPLVRRKIKMNYLYGVRFARSFESDDLWYRINEYGGKRMILWSVPLIVVGVATFFVASEDRAILTILLGLAPMIYLVPCIESYRYANRL